MFTFSINEKNSVLDCVDIADETGITINESFEKEDDTVYSPVDEILNAMENPSRKGASNPVHTHCETVEDLIRLITSDRNEYERAVIS